jgi:NADPH-dependent curcumin reductase
MAALSLEAVRESGSEGLKPSMIRAAHTLGLPANSFGGIIVSETYQRIVLVSRPNGPVAAHNFRLEEVAMVPLADGEVRVRNHFLSLDPYMRGRMSDAKSYAAPQKLNETMGGATVGEVVESRHGRFAVGDTARGMLGWAEYGVSAAGGLDKLDKSAPLSAYLGVLGMTGMTAWYGVNKILEPKAGETLVVSAASGAVGSVVGQLGKFAGLHVVGLAGGSEKCRYVTEELGFDACIDYKTAADSKALAALIAAAAPKGVDTHFENVGGDVLNAVMSLLNPFARVAICGLIVDYSMVHGETPKSAILNPRAFLTARFKMQGFIVSDHMELWPQGLGEIAGYLRAGKLKYRESIVDGLAAAPRAFMGLLKGENFGKQLVRLI